MKEHKNQNGITLVALIITIIVMLIFVVTTVSILINSNVIGTAKSAGERTKTAYNNESNFGESLTINVDGNLYNSIDEYIGTQDDEDLAKLQEFFGKGWETICPPDLGVFEHGIAPIPDADTSILYETMYWTGNISYLVYVYNGEYYQVTMPDGEDFGEVSKATDLTMASCEIYDGNLDCLGTYYEGSYGYEYYEYNEKYFESVSIYGEWNGVSLLSDTDSGCLAVFLDEAEEYAVFDGAYYVPEHGLGYFIYEDKIYYKPAYECRLR